MNAYPLQCVILAGGLGTRMKPITEKLPKALIAVSNRPFVSYQLSWLKRQNVDNVILSVAHMGERIQAAIPNGDPWGLRLRYISEGKDLMGTAGALRLALDAGALENRFLVLYGDSFLPIDVAPIWTRSSANPEDALMTVFKNQGQWDRSNARFDGGRVILYDKKPSSENAALMQYIDYGLSVIPRMVIDREVPPGANFDLSDIFRRLSMQRRLQGFEVFNRFYEIGSPAGLADFERYIAQHPEF